MDQVDVLDDKCYIRLIESWGSDQRIVEAARMSTDKGFLGWGHTAHYEKCPNYGDKLPRYPKKCDACDAFGGDECLLEYLYSHKHMTPFEMAGLTIEVQAPIFVFREWHRHRTQSYNELSARYTELPNMFYMPTEQRINMGRQSVTNKQSSDEGTILPREWHEMTRIQELIHGAFTDARETYEELLKMGVARELARIVIPVAQISRMRASANLRNWLAFLTLRMDPAAQWEIRCYANALALLIEKTYPRTWELFAKER